MQHSYLRSRILTYIKKSHLIKNMYTHNVSIARLHTHIHTQWYIGYLNAPNVEDVHNILWDEWRQIQSKVNKYNQLKKTTKPKNRLCGLSCWNHEGAEKKKREFFRAEDQAPEKEVHSKDV